MREKGLDVTKRNEGIKNTSNALRVYTYLYIHIYRRILVKQKRDRAEEVRGRVYRDLWVIVLWSEIPAKTADRHTMLHSDDLQHGGYTLWERLRGRGRERERERDKESEEKEIYRIEKNIFKQKPRLLLSVNNNFTGNLKNGK